ncbi:MAG: IS5/IS1182 family transposase, partial [Gallionellaceae bacterium]
MRGADITQESLFVVKQTADYIPADHPLIAIREILNQALRELDS